MRWIRVYVGRTKSIANKKDFAAHLTAILERELNTITTTASNGNKTMVAGAVN